MGRVNIRDLGERSGADTQAKWITWVFPNAAAAVDSQAFVCDRDYEVLGPAKVVLGTTGTGFYQIERAGSASTNLSGNNNIGSLVANTVQDITMNPGGNGNSFLLLDGDRLWVDFTSPATFAGLVIQVLVIPTSGANKVKSYSP